MFHLSFLRATAIAALVALGGCRSIKATYVGDAAHGEEVGGLPIVVLQPKYLKVTYTIVTWRCGAGRSEREEESREIATETIATATVYALDLERPAAGKSDWAIAFAKDGTYPAKIGAKVEDRTIATVAEAAADLSSARGSPATADRVRVRATVDRVEIYDLRDLARPIAVWR